MILTTDRSKIQHLKPRHIAIGIGEKIDCVNQRIKRKTMDFINTGRQNWGVLVPLSQFEPDERERAIDAYLSELDNHLAKAA